MCTTPKYPEESYKIWKKREVHCLPFPAGVHAVSPTDIWQCLQLCLAVTAGGSACKSTIMTDRGQECWKHSTTHGTAPATKSCPAPNVDHAELKHASSWAKQTRKSCHIAWDVYPPRSWKLGAAVLSHSTRVYCLRSDMQFPVPGFASLDIYLQPISALPKHTRVNCGNKVSGDWRAPVWSWLFGRGQSLCKINYKFTEQESREFNERGIPVSKMSPNYTRVPKMISVTCLRNQANIQLFTNRCKRKVPAILEKFQSEIAEMEGLDSLNFKETSFQNTAYIEWLFLLQYQIN